MSFLDGTKKRDSRNSRKIGARARASAKLGPKAKGGDREPFPPTGFERSPGSDATRESRTAAHTRGAILFASLAAALACAGCASPTTGRHIDARIPRAKGLQITESENFGPLYEKVTTSAGDTRTSIRPFLYSSIDVPSEDASVTEVLWPLYDGHRRHEHLRWRFLNTIYTDFDVADPESRRSLWIFPFWFSGKADSGDEYAALFPICGTIRDLAFIDKMSFILWPLYFTTEQNEMRGTYVLWPFIAKVEGGRHRRFRVFPFYMHSRKDGEYETRAVMWPLWIHTRHLREPAAGYEWALFPIYGQADRGVEKSWYVIPPLFQYTRGYGKNEGYRRILAPWPLVRVEDTKNVKKRHFFPFYAKTWTSDKDSVSFLANLAQKRGKSEDGDGGKLNLYASKLNVAWPLYAQHYQVTDKYEKLHWTLAPIMSRTRFTPSEGAVAQGGLDATDISYFRLWPLFSYDRADDDLLVSFPDFSLWRRAGVLERNFLRMFTLYTYGTDGARSVHDALWGMLRLGYGSDGYGEQRVWPLFSRRKESSGESADWSVLMGLLGRETADDGARRTRYLWFFHTSGERISQDARTAGEGDGEQ